MLNTQLVLNDYHYEGLNLLCYSSIHQKRSESEPSCVSMRSDGSMFPPVHFKSGDTQTHLRYTISGKK